jgi:hypothetical protein
MVAGGAVAAWCGEIISMSACDFCKTGLKQNNALAKLARPVALCFSEVVARISAVEAVAQTLKSLIRELVENGTRKGASLIEPAAEPAHALAPEEIGR